MVGLSVVLEAHNLKNAATPTTKKTVMPLVINKATKVKPPPPPPSNPSSAGSADRSFCRPVGDSFLDACFLCRQRLLPGKDIYMYKGDKAFCSEECRLKQMLMDEYDEENSTTTTRNSRGKLETPNYNNNNNNYCSLVAVKLTKRWISPPSFGK